MYIFRTFVRFLRQQFNIYDFQTLKRTLLLITEFCCISFDKNILRKQTDVYPNAHTTFVLSVLTSSLQGNY